MTRPFVWPAPSAPGCGACSCTPPGRGSRPDGPRSTRCWRTGPDPPPPMKVQTGAQLSRLTTLRVGGPARRLIEASDEQEIVEAVREADAAGDRLLVMGQGSNLVVA